ncbi:MAG: T9SS type A sorting domain-containing protein [Bacteroidia bacterium]|nr:T9SS type A sorting domain-containing protein [Bacteroidia bacterium]
MIKHYLKPPAVILPFLFLFFLLSSTALFATHSMGADVTYSCIGPNQYLVKLTFFRDCDGIFPIPVEHLTYSSASCGVSAAINLTQPSVAVDVTPLCPSATSSCAGGNSPFGIEQYTYTGILNLPSGCGTDWILGWSNCCRNFAITTLNIPGNQSMFASARLNNTISPCNNSPVFNNIPTPIVCLNTPVIYNHAVTDIDGDSLVFSLTNCMQDVGLPVIYNPGYSAVNPLTTLAGVSIDPQTGEITFTPNQIQIGVICVKVDEYRNGVKIGETVRDMQFSVVSCTNQPPVASGINGNSNTFDIDICTGSTVCFDINITDPDGDNVMATWNAGIPGANFSIANNGSLNPTGSFCWTPGASDLGSHFFTVSVEDDNCPLTASATYAFTVNVSTSSYSLNAGADGSVCNGGSLGLSAVGAGASNFTWSPTTGLSNPNISNPVATPGVSTVYTVSATFPDGCILSDFVTVDISQGPSLSILPASPYICPGSSLNLTAVSPDASGFLWNTAAVTSSILVSPLTTTTYSVIATGADGCEAYDTVMVNVNTPAQDQCNVLYASPGANGAGTALDPASLTGAIALASCNDVVIKLDTGTYTINAPITNILGNLTLEGGFVRTNNWKKTSKTGSTKILRTALNPEGPANGQRIVAFHISNASNFRFQDITILTSDATGNGMSTYGVYLSNCSDYSFVRCQIIAGDASAGANGTNGADGIDGADGSDGTDGEDDFQDFPGEGGKGGEGGGAGYGAGGPGGTDQNGTGNACCDFGNNSCCLDGGDGDDGLNSANTRAGGGGGGGGGGGEASHPGGQGGRGGGVGVAGALQCCGGTGGPGGNPGQDGIGGVNGANGTNGTNGVGSPAGSHTGGFWVPGAQAASGTNATGGKGGTGGGGGGGEQCFVCFAGAGSGGGGGGGGGEGGAGGTGGFGGGSSYAVYLYNNGVNTIFRSCNLTAGTAGAGGPGGQGGQPGQGGIKGEGSTYNGNGASQSVGEGGDGGKGGNGGEGGDGASGSAGQSLTLYQNGGQAPATAEYAFNLSSQPVIDMENVSCVNTDVDFSAPASNLWDLGAGASPQITTGVTVTTQYSNTGRKDITYAGNVYAEFANIILDDAVKPEATTNAPLVSGEYRICAGSSVDFSALNGGSGYMYQWDMGGGSSPNSYNGSTYNSITGISFLTPGTYHIRLQYQTDCCGLSTADTVTLIVDETPVLAISGPADFCAGTGGTTLNASGAASYVWGPSVGLTTTTGPDVIANPSSTTTYTITGTNAAGTCYDQTTATVTVHDLSLAVSDTDANCTPDGTATVTPSLGSGSYQYTWNTSPSQTGATATGLAEGNYQVVVLDMITGCEDSASVYVGKIPGTLSAVVTAATEVSCSGGGDASATVTVSGVSGSLSYTWLPSGGTGATANGLAAGDYSVTITEVPTGCITTAEVTIVEPSPLLVELLDSTQADCNTFAEITVNASGGNGPFSYTWNTVPPQTGATAINLEAATYTVTVEDQNGCLETLDITIPGPESPVILTLVDSTSASDCLASDGSIEVIGSGSNGNITYDWQTTPPQTGPLAVGLLPGPYTVIATGANGCTDVLGITIGPACPLPSEYLHFLAKRGQDQILLEWETVSEQQNFGFEVQKSMDGTLFTHIGWVPSQSTGGKGAAYVFADTNVFVGKTHIYRLRQLDANGNGHYSPRAEVFFPGNGFLEILRVFPVPARSLVVIEISATEISLLELHLHNLLGQKVGTWQYQLSAGINRLQVDIHTLPAGMYVGSLLTDGQVQTELKLIKSE